MKLVVGQFVACLILPIVLAVLLDRIVCEVNVDVFKVLKGKELGASPQIALGVPVGFEISVHNCYHHVVSDVKFSAVVKEWIGDIRLHYSSLRLPI